MKKGLLSQLLATENSYTENLTGFHFRKSVSKDRSKERPYIRILGCFFRFFEKKTDIVPVRTKRWSEKKYGLLFGGQSPAHDRHNTRFFFSFFRSYFVNYILLKLNN